MPALPPYMPTKEANFNLWLLNFSSLISANPAAYGLTPADATTIAGEVGVWTAAYTPTTSKATKTPTAVSAKNTARVTVTAQIRTYAQAISNNPGVSSANKTALGLNPKTSTPQPITAPTTNPLLMLQSCSNLSAYVRYRDSAASVSVKAKPYGVTQCQVFGMTAATPVTDPTTLPLLASPTKSPFLLTFKSTQAGQQLYLAARWATRTGLVSPWSPIINFTVVAGG